MGTRGYAVSFLNVNATCPVAFSMPRKGAAFSMPRTWVGAGLSKRWVPVKPCP